MFFLIGGAFMLSGSGFFTANLLQPHNNDLLVREISLLPDAVQKDARALYVVVGDDE